MDATVESVCPFCHQGKSYLLWYTSRVWAEIEHYSGNKILFAMEDLTFQKPQPISTWSNFLNSVLRQKCTCLFSWNKMFGNSSVNKHANFVWTDPNQMCFDFSHGEKHLNWSSSAPEIKQNWLVYLVI